MFSLPNNGASKTFDSEINQDSTFKIKPFDLLKIEVYTKAGELLIDPELRLRESSSLQSIESRENIYLVDKNGNVKLPMIGDVLLLDMDVRSAESFIENEFTKFYDKLYVTIQFKNKRVYVLGASGGKVIPLENENTTLIEVIALAGGIDNTGNAGNIRLIRGEEVLLADLTTFEGYKAADRIVQHGDIVYIEPVRRPFVETLREVAPGIGVISGLISLTALILNLVR
ncbi:MAG: polysaccharide biosynthesis/export family protein [Cyclobacteriaceae bacterium]|nr:polysaccharide biosynthesis/export family protein [Cyclobacteriaceae bacterium]